MERIEKLISLKGNPSNYRIARDLGVRESTVRTWRSGRVPKVKNLNILADYFQVDPAWLLYGDENRRPTIEGDLQYLFKETADFIKKNPESLTYIRNMLRGIIGGKREADFVSRGIQKKKGKQRKTA